MNEGKDVEQTIENSNSRFYEAFESLSIEKMGQVWKHSDDTICIHPGWEMFTSWAAISESWLSIFENTQMIKFVITNIKIKVFENVAVVVCLENIDSVIIEDKNSIRMGVIATNIFEKQNVNNHRYKNEWLMIHHHGSSVANYIASNVTV